MTENVQERQEYMETKKVDAIQIEREIAQMVLKEHIIKTLREIDQIYFYKDGVYQKDKNNTYIRQWIDQIAQDYLVPDKNNKGLRLIPYKLTNAKRSNILEFIKVETFCSIDLFDSNPNILNLKNGIYSFEGFKNCVLPNPNSEDGVYHSEIDDKLVLGIKNFISHDYYKQKFGDYYPSFVQFPIIYNKEAENLEIDQLLTDIFGFKVVPLMYQMIAYCFMPDVKYGKAYMLYGETHTGKTTFLNILIRLIGEQYISDLELQDLGTRFQLLNLINKVVNVFDDLGNKPLYDNKWFRKVVTNSRLKSEKKGVQDHIGWKNRTKLIYSCNELPEVKNECNEAFFTRWVLISCNNDMRDLEGFNHLIRDKEYSEEEISGTFNKIIQAWKKLEEDKGFPKEWNNTEYVKDLWLMDSNPLGLFIKEKCEIDPSYQFERKLFLQEVNKFRREKNAKEIKQNKCSRALAKCLGAESSEDITISINERSKGWYPDRLTNRDYKGLRIKDYKINDKIKRMDDF